MSSIVTPNKETWKNRHWGVGYHQQSLLSWSQRAKKGKSKKKTQAEWIPETFKSSLRYDLNGQCGALIKDDKGKNKVYTRAIEASRDLDADGGHTLGLAHIAEVGGEGSANWF